MVTINQPGGIYLSDTKNTEIPSNLTGTVLSTKLSRAIGMLYKIRHFVKYETLRMIYFGIFSSILMYSCQIWGQNTAITKKLQILQNKALRAITFKPSRASASPLFKNCEILKLTDNISLQNFLFAHDSLKNNLPCSLTGKLTLVDTIHSTRNETYCQLDRPRNRTVIYGSKSIKSRSVDIWNYINRHSHHVKLNEKSRPVCKKIVTKFLVPKGIKYSISLLFPSIYQRRTRTSFS